MASLKPLSKFLSLLLRHRADDFGLTLDDEGFTDLETVWMQVQRRYGDQYSRGDFETLLSETTAGKQRFEVRETTEGRRIRALYGHSRVSVTYPPAVPPDVLYHGTTPEALPSIRRHGLTSQKRQYVHLSTSIERAQDVAGRHGTPVILVIRARAGHDAGHIYYHPEPQHYLTKFIPPEFILFPD